MASIESGELTFVDGGNAGTNVQLVALSDGKTLVVYVGATQSGGTEAFGKVLDAQGAQVGSPFQLSESGANFVGSFDTAKIDDGHIAIVFNAFENAAQSAPVRAAVFDPIAMANGGAIPSSFLVAEPFRAYSRASVEVIDGDLAFVWSSTDQFGQSSTFATVLDGDTHEVVTAETALFNGNVSDFQDITSFGSTFALTGSNPNFVFLRASSWKPESMGWRGQACVILFGEEEDHG